MPAPSQYPWIPMANAVMILPGGSVSCIG
jgi:hypothetical protein